MNKFNFSANVDRNSEVLNILDPFVAVAIRIHPVTWNNLICMRLEAYCSEV